MKNLNPHLGKLFYAIASCDKKIEQAEISEFKNQIKINWLNTANSNDITFDDDLNEIEMMFVSLVNQNADSKKCFQDFSNFFNENKELFSSTTKKQIWKIAEAIASSFNSKNKAELVMLSRLAIQLSK